MARAPYEGHLGRRDARMRDFRDDPSTSISSIHTGETFDRLARQQDDVRRSLNALIFFGRVVAAEWLIEESSRYSFGEEQA